MRGDISKLFVGIDESNHGRYPEIFSAIFSIIPQDIIEQPNLLVKKRDNHRGLFTKLSKRDYSFIVIGAEDYEKLRPVEFIGHVAVSLLQEKIPQELDELRILIDGEVLSNKKLYTRSLISDIYGIEKEIIRIESGKDLDRRYRLVNIADELSHYLFRRCSLEKLSRDVHRRPFV